MYQDGDFSADGNHNLAIPVPRAHNCPCHRERQQPKSTLVCTQLVKIK